MAKNAHIYHLLHQYVKRFIFLKLLLNSETEYTINSYAASFSVYSVMEVIMENIVVGILCVIVAFAGIFGWWYENGSSKKEKNNSNTK